MSDTRLRVPGQSIFVFSLKVFLHKPQDTFVCLPVKGRLPHYFFFSFYKKKNHLLSSHNLTNPAHLLLPLSCLGGSSLECRDKIGGPSGGACGNTPQALPPALASPLVPRFVTLDLNLIYLKTYLLATVARGLGPVSGLLAPEVHVVLCPARPI